MEELFYNIVDPEKLEHYIKNNSNININSFHYIKINEEEELVSPLCFAILLGEYESIKILIEYGADVNLGRRGKCLKPIFQAAMNETSTEIIELLLEKCDIYAKDMNYDGGWPANDYTLLNAFLMGQNKSIAAHYLYRLQELGLNYTDDNYDQMMYSICTALGEGNTNVIVSFLNNNEKILNLIYEDYGHCANPDKNNRCLIDKQYRNGVIPVAVALRRWKFLDYLFNEKRKGQVITYFSHNFNYNIFFLLTTNSFPELVERYNIDLSWTGDLLSPGISLIDMAIIKGNTDAIEVLKRKGITSNTPTLRLLYNKLNILTNIKQSKIHEEKCNSEEVFNFISYAQEQTVEFLKDEDALVFAFNSGAVGYSKEEILSIFDVDTSIYVGCNSNRNGNYTVSSLENVEKFDISLDSNLFLKIPTQNGQYFVELEEFLNSLDIAIKENKRIFYIGEIIQTIERTISYHIAYGHLNNKPYNMVSADHCQEGTNKDIRRLYICN